MTSRPRPRPPTLVALAVVALVPFVVLRLKLIPVDDPDSFWHVLSGQHVWQAHEVVVDDPFGRFSTNPWVQIDWLSDLAMAGVHAVAGLAGVAWLYATLGILLFVALYVAARRSAPPLTAGIVATLGWAGTYASQGFRPQTVSFVLLAVTLVAWDRVRRGESGTPWWLVALTWVWACLHGLWFLGPLVGLTVVLGLALDRSRPGRELLRLLAVPVAGLAAACLTPIGPSLLTTPFTVNAYAGLVSEWRPPDVHEPYVAGTVVLLVVTALAWARSGERARTPDILLWVMALGWTLLYARTVAIGAVIAVPLAATALASLLPLPAEPGARRVERLLLPVSAVAAVLLAAVLAPSVAGRAGGMPTALDGAIDRLPRDTVVLNDDAVGGWLLLEHPAVHPVIDTRTYLFDVPYITAYTDARATRSGWPGFVAYTDASAALVRREEPLVPGLLDELGWIVLAEGDGWVLVGDPARVGS
ncbi:hypothetical protein [Oryzobacter terrae]|uniref:hypothetical protein n=1 Tax=Oryzobacter terrae TaxID=1620385 RepID=UPI00366F52C5